ncbi:MAG: type II toxin-antitoxin system RelE/ParE family toxin [Nitrosomonas sp.]|nr:type II toxin-antitoxin system RelE/ParE family toxin [Nitrosomonas sp.]
MPYPTITNLELSKLAQADLEDIAHYTYLKFGSEQVDIYFEAMLTGMHAIASTPDIGHKRSDIPQNYKAFRVQKHILIYIQKEKTVYLSRIIHQSRDFKRHDISDT